MKHYFKYIFTTISILLIFNLYAQNQNKKWYFGNQAALDFMSGSPTVLSNSAMNAWEGCSSIADISGNLLFYTDGMTVWNKQHQVMANGTGLLGDASASQSGLIIKQPGNSNIYFIFTLDYTAQPNGLRYSTVDMNLAAGMGSVTIKNTLIVTPSTEKIAATRHCNGIDVWVVSHDYGSNNFRSILVTSAGVSTSPVISSVGTIINNTSYTQGCMQISPTGKRIGMAMFYLNGSNTAPFELFDFDNTTGAISNSFIIKQAIQAYGCEFSPDGTKFYGSSTPTTGQISQWNLCAGSNAAIAASEYTFSGSGAAIQRATDGKLYVSNAGPFLGVINNPNAAGAACNYVVNGLAISPGVARLGLPGMLFEKIPPGPFTYTTIPTTCNTLSFTPPPPPTITVTACTAVGYSLTNLVWNFDDPASGSNNTSTISQPTHHFPGPGTYTTQLIYYYSCGGGTDTIKQVVTVGALPVVSSQGFTVCNGQSITLAASGNTVYSWSTGASSASITVSPSVTTNYTVSGITSAGCTNSTVITVTVSPGPLISITGNNTLCAGSSVVQTATGANSYTWSTGATTNTVSLNPIANAIYTVTGVNASGCSNTATTLINVISAAGLSVTNPTACIGAQVVISVINNLPGYMYTWYPGALSGPSITVSPSTTSNYTLVANYPACNFSTTLVSIVTINSIVPAITGFNYNTPVCANSGNLFPGFVNGFNTGGIFNSPGLNVNSNTGEVNLSPIISGTFSVTYSFAATGCTTAASSSATIVILAAPSLSISPNVNIIPGASTTLSVSGGLSYTWSPVNYLSCVDCENPIANPPDNMQYCVTSELNSCISKACVDITVSCETGNDHSVPNAFTPNGDGNNDAFCLQGWSDCITDFNVMIFDRWGEKVFESNDPAFCWDGIYRGKLMDAAVFVYVIKATKYNKEQLGKKGNITLIR